MNKNNCNEYIYSRYNGIITKYKKINDKEYIEVKTGLVVDTYTHLILGQTSDNIIDLIKAGDFVNGYKVYAVLEDMLHLVNYNGLIIKVAERQIKSVVTSEQFKSVEYKVGE